MNRALKAKWLEALRSGKYKQVSGSLCRVFRDKASRSHPQHCCLGVLGSVCGYHNEFMNNKETLTEIGLGVLGDWLPADEDYTKADRRTLQKKLSLMNDEGKSFAEIADWIEVNVDEDDAPYPSPEEVHKTERRLYGEEVEE